MWLAVLHNVRNAVMWLAVLHNVRNAVMWLAVENYIMWEMCSNVIGCVT